MGVSILDMSVSLDGYIADTDDYLGGDDGERLHKWADAEGESAQPSAPIREFDAEWKADGAVLAGQLRRQGLRDDDRTPRRTTQTIRLIWPSGSSLLTLSHRWLPSLILDA
jgi:hypothetical protein